MSAVQRVVAGASRTPAEVAGGIEQLPAGRHTLTAACVGAVESIVVEQRGGAVAIKHRGRWYAVGADGAFVARTRTASGRVTELSGTLRLAGSALTLVAVESVLATGECKRWEGAVELRGTAVSEITGDRRVVMRGTARYSFLDGPTETPLRVAVDLVERVGVRTVVLPPALTTSRGTLELPVAGDGTFGYRAADGSAFKVAGRLERHALELVIETAGSIGWTRKELSATL